MSAVSCRKRYMDEAVARWGHVCAEEIRESLEKTADAAEFVNSYPLKPSDEPSDDLGRSRFDV